MSGPSIALPYCIQVQLYGWLGTHQIVEEYRRGSNRTGVWKIATDHQCFFLKTHSRKSRWHPEVYAYRNWIPAISPYAPELVAYFEEDGWQGILVSALDGAPMRESSLTKPQVEECYRKAGELTRMLHSTFVGNWFGRPDKDGNPIEIPHDSDPVRYMRSSLSEMLDGAVGAGCISVAETRLVEWAIENSEVFADSVPVPVSWDSTPKNWLVNRRGEFTGMIDFENMLWGVAQDNFPVLFARYFPECPSGKSAFFDGYGLDVEKLEPIGTAIVCVKAALGDVLWGMENGHERNVALGRRMLYSLRHWGE